MKKSIIAVTIGLLICLSAHAASSYVGQCVIIKHKVTKTGLVPAAPVFIVSAPGATDGRELKTFEAFTVKAEKDGYVQLVTVPNYDLPDPDKAANKVVGWAKRDGFKMQDLRNCN